ncbi:Uncharacterised protein [Yersinia enterocolitica]|nr:Uncharacterised protein [Yersinia enterocolitica]HEI6738501.1 hypothetical protein [Yersinia enterocolitica]
MAKLSVQVGIRRAGYVEYECDIYPEYSMGMAFIVTTAGVHVAVNLQDVNAIIVTPAKEEK